MKRNSAFRARARLLGFVLTLGVSVGAGGFGAEDSSESARPALAVPVAEAQRGLLLELTATRGDASLRDARVARTVGLHVARGEGVSPMISRGPFRARYTGLLEIPRRDRYAFRFEGRGQLELRIDGETVLSGRASATKPVVGEAVRLRKGAREFEAVFTPALGGTGTLRLLWSSRRFPDEPIPPSAFSFDSDRHGTPDPQRVRADREALGALGCAVCHKSDKALPNDLLRIGADLSVAHRQPGWIAARLRSDPDTGPDPVHRRFDEQQSKDLATHVASLQSGDEIVGVAGDAAQGARLWADLGCFACHGFDPNERGSNQRSELAVSLRGVSDGFRLGAIADFLLDPRAARPSTAMPDFGLSSDEAAHLEAFLRATDEGEGSFAKADGDAARGAALYEAQHCGACHSAQSKPLAAPGLTQVLGDAGASGTKPCSVLGAALGETPVAGGFVDSLSVVDPIEAAKRILERRRCDACHVMDGETSRWAKRVSSLEALGISEHPTIEGGEEVAEQRVEQLRPRLTWTGDKLRKEWLIDFLDESKDLRVRSWLRARMPKLPRAEAEILAEGLARMHGHGADPEPLQANPALVSAGSTLVGTQGGFSCGSCHTVGGVAPATAFEVLGVSFDLVAERLRPDYYRRWMWDPARIEPESRMPKYAGDDGRTALTETLGGDARKQFDAIWHYLHGGEGRR